MKKISWLKSWPRLLLWSHVIGVVWFYIGLWIRTSPTKNSQVKVLPPRSNDAIPATANPFISIIVPARNEERNILRCVESLLVQDYDNYEVIVVDDGSNDGTGTILAELQRTHTHRERLSVLHLHEELPQDWAGKPHALHRGIERAQGEWLLFTDADTRHMSNALRSSIAQALSEQCDMLTLGITHELPSFWERTLMPMAFLLISMLYPPKLVNNPDSKVALASGAYILIRHKVYADLGGYARTELRGTLVDDLDLAYTVKSHGYKLRFIDGNGLVHVRMYQSFGETWRGWRKNVYVGNRGGWPLVLLQLPGLLMFFIVPFLLPLYAKLLSRRNTKGGVSTREAGIATIVELTPLLAYRLQINRRMNVPWYYALTHPLAAGVFGGILAQSMWRVVTRKGVDWRGRQYYNNRDLNHV
jgi:chlorobactene glucosyltransferase